MRAFSLTRFRLLGWVSPIMEGWSQTQIFFVDWNDSSTWCDKLAPVAWRTKRLCINDTVETGRPERCWGAEKECNVDAANCWFGARASAGSMDQGWEGRQGYERCGCYTLAAQIVSTETNAVLYLIIQTLILSDQYHLPFDHHPEAFKLLLNNLKVYLE